MFITNLNFIQLFTQQQLSLQQEGYCLTTFQLAIEWIKTANYELLKTDQLTYKIKIYEQEVKLGLSSLNQRKRMERAVIDLKKLSRASTNQ